MNEKTQKTIDQFYGELLHLHETLSGKEATLGDIALLLTQTNTTLVTILKILTDNIEKE